MCPIPGRACRTGSDELFAPGPSTPGRGTVAKGQHSDRVRCRGWSERSRIAGSEGGNKTGYYDVDERSGVTLLGVEKSFGGGVVEAEKRRVTLGREQRRRKDRYSRDWAKRSSGPLAGRRDRIPSRVARVGGAGLRCIDWGDGGRSAWVGRGSALGREGNASRALTWRISGRPRPVRLASRTGVLGEGCRLP